MARVYANWERLVRATLSREQLRNAGQAPERIGSVIAGAVPSSLDRTSNIDAILQAADEIQDENRSVARIQGPVHISKHRTCWLHTAAFLHARKMKVSKQKIRDFELCAPCFLGTFPSQKRSKTRVKQKYMNPVKSKNTATKQKRLDSREFGLHIDNLWRSFSEDKKTYFTYLDSLWFDLYRKPSSRAKVLTWIKRKRIFSKKYVLIPIVCWSHWNLLIFCNFGESLESKTRTPCMLLLDSLEMSNPRRFEPEIRKFVLDIFKTEDRSETKKLISQIPFLVPKVPQQRNGEECGNFVLYFINLFVEGAPDNFSIEGYPYFMEKNWFTPEGLDSFCERLNCFEK